MTPTTPEGWFYAVLIAAWGAGAVYVAGVWLARKVRRAA